MAKLTTLAAKAAAALREGLGSAQDLRRNKPPQPLVDAPELLKQLNALADRHGVVIGRTSYRLTRRDALRRLEVSMPLKVSYPSLRGYLRDALTLSASAALDELSLQRANAGDTVLEAQVRLSYGFAAAP